MATFEQVVADLRAECSDDYVGLWEVVRLLRDGGMGSAESAERIVAVVAALLDDPEITIGQFADGTFREWPGNAQDRVARLERELVALGRTPDIGDVAWLVRR